MTEEARAFACDLTTLTAEERERLIANAKELFASAQEVRVLANGYAVGYAGASAGLISRIADFIAYDRLCCPFIRYELVAEPYGGTTWLRLTGEEGVKEVITEEVMRLVRGEVAAAAGLQAPDGCC